MQLPGMYCRSFTLVTKKFQIGGLAVYSWLGTAHTIYNEPELETKVYTFIDAYAIMQYKN